MPHQIARTGRLLVVSAHPPAESSAIALLGQHGHELLHVDSGAQALALASRQAPDLILLDLLLPGLSGREVCAEVRKVAAALGLDWFVRTVIAPVPAPFAGAYREVFPGFFTLTGFLTSTGTVSQRVDNATTVTASSTRSRSCGATSSRPVQRPSPRKTSS